jgi:DNA invertase Pin-like site-specific DNA recombinase
VISFPAQNGNNMRNRCVIFVRVSTKDKQSTDRQVNELNQVASSRNLKVVEVIEEKVSGTLKNDQREGIQRLLDLSRKGKYDILLVSEISRLSRNTYQL